MQRFVENINLLPEIMPYAFFLSIFFMLGYLCIIFEKKIKINKTAIALLLGMLCWVVQFLYSTSSYTQNLKTLSFHVWKVSQLVLFLLGTLTLVEIINTHNGFSIITDQIKSRSKRKILLAVSLITFFLSAIFDNFTITIVMLSLLQKIVPDKERFIPGAMVIVSANAGGTWSTIGNLTTTFLWIENKISTLGIIKAAFIPCVVSFLVPLAIFYFLSKGKYSVEEIKKEERDKRASLIFILGMIGLIFVPIFRFLTGLPHFIGTLFSLGILWIVTDILYKKEDIKEIKVQSILTKIDISGILFFLGIIMAIGALQASGSLGNLHNFLTYEISNPTFLNLMMGFISSIISSIAVATAGINMYPSIPMDSNWWHMFTYCVGVGGSILVMGSAAGVAFVSKEKVDFFMYIKKISLPVILGYLIGIFFI